MIDIENIRYMIRATKSDRTVFIVTLFLTVFVDITIAIEVGALLALLFFTSRMIELTEEHVAELEEHSPKDNHHADLTPYDHGLHYLPNEIEMIHIAGPFFFGVASRVRDILGTLSESPKVIILDMQNVPFIDASGVLVLKDFMHQAKSRKIYVILTAVNKKVKKTLFKMSGQDDHAYGEIIDNRDKAIERAYSIKEK